MNNSLIYSNARVKTMENSLLTSEKITRMVFADNLEEGVKVLTECGYGGETLTEIDNFEDILTAENKRVSDFVAESMPSGCGLESFIISNDYHNAKVMAKAKYAHIEDYNFMVAPKGMIDIEDLHEFVFNDNYTLLPKFMAEALESIDTAFANNNRSPRYIDITLDKAMYKDILACVKKAKTKSLIKYWESNIDYINISTFCRCKNIGLEEKEFEDNFIDGGTLSIGFFSGAYDQGREALADKMKYTDYKNAGECIAENNMTALEVAWDNYLLAIFRDDRNDLFSISPLAGFYIAKKIEVKVVRMILILLKNNIDKQAIKERLRDYYA